ncbi:MAG: acetolactate synthase small subunit, partial [Candidatus Hydrothermarchaeaceae archaeon]
MNTEDIHVLVALVEDRPGVMQRVSGLFRKRNFNIDSITVGHSEKEGISRITLMVRGDERIIEQVKKHKSHDLEELLKIVKEAGDVKIFVCTLAAGIWG